MTNQGNVGVNSIKFIDPDGNHVGLFNAQAERIVHARSLVAENLSRPAREGDLLRARNQLATAISGAAFRGGALREQLKIRMLDGREWPDITTRDGPGPSEPPSTSLDPKSLGTYADKYGHSTGDGKITDIETYENASTAKMGGYIRGVNRSPGNKEILTGHAESGFWWTYKPRQDCRLEIRGIAVETYARQFRDLADEGFIFAPQISNAHLTQDNFLTVGYFNDNSSSLDNYGKVLNSVGPGSAYAGDGEHSNRNAGPYGTVGATGFADRDEVVRNGNRTVEFRYRPSVSAIANTEMYCFFGARSSFHADLDDVKATIRQGGTWAINRLSVVELT